MFARGRRRGLRSNVCVRARRRSERAGQPPHSTGKVFKSFLAGKLHASLGFSVHLAMRFEKDIGQIGKRIIRENRRALPPIVTRVAEFVCVLSSASGTQKRVLCGVS